jgi:hypothetical protein
MVLLQEPEREHATELNAAANAGQIQNRFSQSHRNKRSPSRKTEYRRTKERNKR